MRRNNRAIPAEKGIEEPAFAGVGRPNQHDSRHRERAVAGNEAMGQVYEVIGSPVQLGREHGSAQRIDVRLLGEIEIRLEVGHQIEQAVAHCQDGAGQAARQLFERCVELSGAIRVDHAQDRLGASQVDPAAKKGSQRELAGLGVPRALAQAIGQNQAGERRRADQMNLGGVLAGVGAWRGPEGEPYWQRRPQALDSQLAGVDRGIPRARRRLAIGEKAFRGDCDRLGAGKSDDSPEPRPRGRCGGRDRVVGVEGGEHETASAPRPPGEDEMEQDLVARSYPSVEG